mmetsp:Transcript_26027/g.66209  ORF Transcript_26027/g.66209 Transcript_26027/m.66209 type:complete len:142 (-) Transcript_26027:225-650(-)
MESGECKSTLQVQSALVDSVAISPDGKTIVSGSGGDNTVRVWDMESGECKDVLVGNAASDQLSAARAWRAMPASSASALSVVVDEAGEVMTVQTADNANMCIYVPPPHRLDRRHCHASMRLNTIGGFCAGSNLFLLFQVNH